MADKLVAASLQEIAAEGAQGCPLQRVWMLLQATPAALELHVDDHVKQVVWQGLLRVPGLSFHLSAASSTQLIQPNDSSVQSLQSAESMGLVVVASQELRDACLGLYDIRHADTQPSPIQHAILERLAKARAEGVTQNQLGKDFKVEGNKLFYILRSLESRGLVVRRSTLVRNKDSVKGGGSIVLTNLVHLTRYAKHLTLNSHQRFEISNTTEDAAYHDEPEEGDDGQTKGKHLMINDDLPAMKAICEKLQQAEGKVLVVSDLKLTLGYRMSSGHRAWRRLMKRLKEAGFVNVIEAKVGRKVRSCIQLLKAFNEHEFTSASGEADSEQQLKGPKRGQVTEQLVELSVDQQIYDMIEDGGGDGLMMMEVWKRIGLNNKRNYYRIQNMTIKHGILFEAENHKRSTLYRLRTLNSKNKPVEEEPVPEAEESYFPVTNDSHKRAQKLVPVRKNARRKTESDDLADSMVKIDAEADSGNVVVDALQVLEVPSGSMIEAGTEDVEVIPTSTNLSPQPTPSVGNFPPPSLFRIGQPYPCLTVTTTSIQREARIMERLQEERFIVRAELHRWLESISNRKTMMDRKTLTRTLQKLQREGRCKCILLSMPGSTNCGRKRTAEVVLLPSVKVEPDLLSIIHERIRKFDMESRGHGLPREKASASVAPVISGLKRMKVKQKKAPLLSQVDTVKTVALQTNGFIPSKMVRVRMLHYFLWNYTNGFLDEDEYNTPRLTDGSGYRVFGLMAAVQAMPLELFLQIVGSNRMIDSLAERCRQGMRIRDLPETEQVILLENSAGGRLAWLIDILRRLKLIRIVIGHGPVVLQDRWHLGNLSISMIEASLTYAMEEQLFIEQPAPQPLPSLTREAFDLNPRGRHDFDINTKESLDNYWQTLEYFFSGAEPAIARHAFPGSSVPELFGLRSWTSLRIMTIDQRNELVRRMNEGGPEKRKSIQDCAKIAKDLNLTLEQVLRVSYEKNRRVRLQSLQKGEPSFMDAFVSGHSLPSQEHAVEESSAHDLGQMFLTGTSDGTNTDREGDEAEEGDDHVNHISIVTKLKPSRSRRFPWSDKLDRILFYAYAKQRALLGAKMNRVDWNSIPGLPAAPLVCRRRISILKAETTVKKAILNLCSLLAARYEKYCQLVESFEEIQGLGVSDQDTSCIEDGQLIPVPALVPHEQPEYYWDNPEDLSVLSAIDEIIRCKNLVRSCYNKPCHNKRMVGGLVSSSTGADAAGEGAGTSSGNLAVDPLHLSSAAGLMQVSKKPPTKRSQSSGLRSRRVRKKTKTKPASLQTLSTEDLVHQSVGVANAIEFIKLVFLNTSVNSDDVQLPKAFMDSLHQFKESDVFTAFNYLKDHNMVASGQGAQSFVLSDTFYQNAFSSRFPNTTGDESQAMSKWLQEHVKVITQQWFPYSTEDSCGHLLHLFERATIGDLHIGPKVPTEGIGESEDPRTIGCGLKRKAESQEQGARTVKARLEDKDEVYQAVRRERGFPGVEVLLHRQAFSVAELLGSKSQDQLELGIPDNPSTSCQEDSGFEVQREEADGLLDKESGKDAVITAEMGRNEIQRAGEEGLSFKELAQALGMEGTILDLKVVERYVDALESAGHVKRVNAFDHVRVLDQTHAARYFLQFSTKKKAALDSVPSTSTSREADATMEASFGDMGDVTNTLPILPWLTSNGTLNMKILKGLIRRSLGIVTLNPGITEDNLVKRLNVLNPQTARELLMMLELDGKLIARTVISAPVSPPILLRGLIGIKDLDTEANCSQAKHYYITLCNSAK